MEFTIYSVGSAHYLGEILNSVAMLAGAGSFTGVAKIGLLIGVFLVAFQAVIQNTGVQYQRVGVCLLIFMAMFGPTGRALIQDVYTGEVVVVDNVPLGPLAAGSIVSNIGYNMTEQMEQAFSTPAMTKYGFADALNVLVAVRQATMDMQKAAVFNTPTQNTDIVTSWANYIRECTMVQAASNPSLMTQIYNADDPVKALLFDSKLYGTRIYINGPQDLDCTAAHAALSDALDMQSDALFSTMESALPNGQQPGVDAESRVAAAINQLSLNLQSARKFAQTAVLLPLVQGGPESKAIADQQGNAAVMMNQATMQRNVQWAAEGNMFTQYARPFMTFFEGFIYAITPIVAFMIVLGPQGISLAGKYLLILCWLVLWLPIMAVVNLYLNVTVSNEVALMVSQVHGGAGGSFAAIMDMEKIIEKNLGVAGLMMSSVPGLVMFLLYGTSVAATSLAGRLGSGDHIDEKMMSPDLAQPNATLAMSSQYVNDPTRGTMQTGGAELMPSIEAGKQLSSAVTSAEQKATQAQQAFGQEMSTSLSNTLTNAKGTSELGQIAQGMMSSSSQEISSATQQAVDYLTSKDVGLDKKSALQAVGSFTASAGLSTPFGGAEAKATASVMKGLNTNQSVAKGLKELESSSYGTQLKGALTENNGVNFAKAVQSSQQLQHALSDGSKLAETGSEMLSTQKSYQQAQQASDNFKFGGNMSLAAMATQVREHGDTSELMKAVDTYGLGSQVHDRQSRLLGLFGGDADQAAAAAALWTLGQHGHFADMNRAAGFEHGAEATAGNAQRNSTIETPDVGDVRASVANRQHVTSHAMDGAVEARENDVQHHDGVVMNDYARNREDTAATGADWNHAALDRGHHNVRSDSPLDTSDMIPGDTPVDMSHMPSDFQGIGTGQGGKGDDVPHP